ncbi:hypothetical protein F511_24391 [Dorcoceras hygrometricum]|uniref:Remorin C-terminal domain-containing protein n=1 Tax=Dorcoceras hygrometricum TaxID=472368 RepID=A0A2Z7BDI3_9LAMI|nr:hypothetical protein F511_24391 [Dorcoceras hygrometricum]
MRSGYDHDSCDIEFATALAASAYSIHSIQSQETGSGYLRKTSTRKDEPFRPAKTSVSLRRQSQRDTRTSSYSRPTPIIFDDKRSKENLRVRRRINADSWEEAQMIKIRKRYEKKLAEIQFWEKEKKMEENHRLDRRESELETKRSRNMKHYQSKISRIDRLVDAAKAQIEEKRRVQVSNAKEKARKMRAMGKLPVKYCFCF